MKGYFLIIAVLVVVISVLVTLNLFFQQSLQMEIAEQLNRHQILFSKSIATNIESYVQFMKEEVIEVAHELSEKKNVTKKEFDSLLEEEMKHKGLVKANIGLLDEKGDLLFFKGDEKLTRLAIDDLNKHDLSVKPGHATIIGTPSVVTIVSPVSRAPYPDKTVFFSFAVFDIANRFLANIKEGQIANKVYAWVIDKKGNLLYHPTQPGMVGRNLYNADASCFKCHVNFDLEKKIVEGKTTNYGRHIAPSGEDKIIAFSVSEIDTLSWIIAMSTPYSEVTRVTGQSMKLYSYLIISIFLTTTLVSAIMIVLNKKRIQAIEIEKRQKELEHYATELENKVNERTAELKSEKEKLDTIVSAIGGGIVLIDIEGRIQWTNKTMLEMAGHDIKGMFCEDICADCNVSGTYIKDDVDTMILSNLFGRRDKFFQITTAPIRGDDGTVHGHIRLIQDVTEIKKMEDQIIHSEKLAAIGRLAAGIAHEIGNPMTSIFSFVQILRDMEEETFKKESLDTIYFHINRVSEILKQLSGFSKMPAGEPKECRVNEIIETSLNLIQYDKKAKSITITKDLSPSLPEITIDGNLLSQVVVNLILNAIDAMPNEGTLTARSFMTVQEIVLQISDTGLGISREDMPRIFDPFYTTKEKGTGLGLAVSYNIIKKMNGALTVESEAGKGTVFSITLPVNNKAVSS